MKIEADPPTPYQLATTLSGRRVHLTVPLPFQQLTVCREVVYQVLKLSEARGRTLCKSCEEDRAVQGKAVQGRAA